MRFGLLQEADTPTGTTHSHRYFDMVDQVLLAEKMGWDMYGLSEQHFAVGGVAGAAPEVLFPYLMALTSRIKFVSTIALLPHRFNHPLRVAERAATMDIMSHGRFELGTGRGNTMLAMRAFEVSPEENKSQWSEGLDLIREAFLNDPFSWVGKHYSVPPRSLVPKPVQLPHPPFWMAATSPASHEQAAEKGIGVLSTTSFLGLEFLQNSLKLYDDTFDTMTHPFPVNRRKAVVLAGGGVCAETTEEAIRRAQPLLDYAKLSVGSFEILSKLSADYAYMGAMKDVFNKLDDMDYMLKESACVLIGTPDECIEMLKVYQALGAEDVWIRVDTMPHDQQLETIEMFGRHVFPHFRAPESVTRAAEDVLEEIRAMRPAHEEAVRLRNEALREEPAKVEQPA
jgi:alkanesulfonate monooxygenase SsuD/methylene tetrahydromethanopterin reductase-like flavin-dependent oxidoreductase (luciferase family)